MSDKFSYSETDKVMACRHYHSFWDIIGNSTKLDKGSVMDRMQKATRSAWKKGFVYGEDGVELVQKLVNFVHGAIENKETSVELMTVEDAKTVMAGMRRPRHGMMARTATVEATTPTVKAPKAKRTRRTKAQMKAAKVAEIDAKIAALKEEIASL